MPGLSLVTHWGSMLGLHCHYAPTEHAVCCFFKSPMLENANKGSVRDSEVNVKQLPHSLERMQPEGGLAWTLALTDSGNGEVAFTSEAGGCGSLPVGSEGGSLHTWLERV